MIRLINTQVQSKIIDYVAKHGSASTGDVETYLGTITRPTLSRYLKELHNNDILNALGEGRGAKHVISLHGIKVYPFDTSCYDTPLETGHTITYNQHLFDSVTTLFSADEIVEIMRVHDMYKIWCDKTPKEYKDRVFERCAIEFSWKSSKIEGNTYTLLETENLIKNREEASGKTHDEAVMILNQKEAFDLINTDTLHEISLATLTDVHKLVVKDLGIPYELRKAQVGITGTNYTPLMLQTQIREALEDLFTFLSTITHPLEKAVVALAGIAYIQPFVDGNKRTSRHFANLILHAHGLPPVAWRTVDEVAYKKAMIAFYELGNIEPIKTMWIKHYVETFKTFFE